MTVQMIEKPSVLAEQRMSTPQTMALTGFAYSTLANWRNKGVGGPPYYKIGPGRNGRVYYLRSEVEAWLSSRRFES
jgi:predicted DNA-binding transcriptional regulator AlpA